MKFTLYNIGKTDSKYIVEGLNDYSKRIGYFLDFSVIDIPELKQKKNFSPDMIKQKEGELLIRYLSKTDILVLLDEKGTEYKSREFSDWLNKIFSQGNKQVSFVTGGAYGFSEDIFKRAHYKISLSKLTFTHQLVRLVFVEQLYRACTIIKGIPYHND
jgi:23S rRNA (pseudouridine1915-N3)-methyltransferase